MTRQKLACGSLIAIAVLLNRPARPADDEDTSTGAINPADIVATPADIVATIAQTWGLALQVAVRRINNPDALQKAIDLETAEAARRFQTIKCGADTDSDHERLALLAAQRINTEIAALKGHVAVTYQSKCVAGTLAVTFDAKAVTAR